MGPPGPLAARGLSQWEAMAGHTGREKSRGGVFLPSRFFPLSQPQLLSLGNGNYFYSDLCLLDLVVVKAPHDHQPRGIAPPFVDSLNFTDTFVTSPFIIIS